MTSIFYSVMSNLAVRWPFLLQNNPKNLDPSYKMDLDFGIVLKTRSPCLNYPRIRLMDFPWMLYYSNNLDLDKVFLPPKMTSISDSVMSNPAVRWLFLFKYKIIPKI